MKIRVLFTCHGKKLLFWKNAGKSTYDLILAQMNVYNSFPGSDRARSVYSNLFDKKMIYQFLS